MIPDWDTNRLFVSDRLETDFPVVAEKLRFMLQGISIDTIPGTSDIWCRDYMPIPLDDRRFCQFVYSPSYLRGFEHLITPPEQCRLPFMEHYQQEPIVLDGGNVVASRNKVIMTEKIYSENRNIERARLRKRLDEIFRAECIFIPKQAGDDVGHSDGVVRFISEDRVLINDYSETDPSYGAKVTNVLRRYGLEVETLPMFEEDHERRQRDLPSAVGIYINYLRVGNVVVVPGFDRPEDQRAMDRIKTVLPDANVIQLPCRNLAEKGGVLNCVSWTMKGEMIAAAQSEA